MAAKDDALKLTTQVTADTGVAIEDMKKSFNDWLTKKGMYMSNSIEVNSYHNMMKDRLTDIIAKYSAAMSALIK
jgi:hypothetical protein